MFAFFVLTIKLGIYVNNVSASKRVLYKTKHFIQPPRKWPIYKIIFHHLLMLANMLENINPKVLKSKYHIQHPLAWTCTL